LQEPGYVEEHHGHDEESDGELQEQGQAVDVVEEFDHLGEVMVQGADLAESEEESAVLGGPLDEARAFRGEDDFFDSTVEELKSVSQHEDQLG
jgi:hypothetical protein